MNYIKFVYLSVFCGIVSILAFFNIIYSYYLNLYLNLNTYVYTFVVSALLTLIFYISKNNDEKKTTIYEKILTILLGYFLLPIIIAIPFYFSIYNLTFVNSYFEAISGFTSTGFTIFNNINHIDQSLILWRSASQWVGGLYFLFSIILLIDIFDYSFKKSLTNFIIKYAKFLLIFLRKVSERKGRGDTLCSNNRLGRFKQHSVWWRSKSIRTNVWI